MMEARLGRKEHARALFSRAVGLEARDSRLLTAWASLERTCNNWMRSEELLEQALEADACNPVALQVVILPKALLQNLPFQKQRTLSTSGSIHVKCLKPMTSSWQERMLFQRV